MGTVEYSSRTAEQLQRLDKVVEGHALELGGELPKSGVAPSQQVPSTLTFVPPDELWSAHLFVSFGAPLPGPHAEIESNVTDPLSELRAASAEGRAHEAGLTQVEGRTLERIAFQPPSVRTPSRLVDPAYVYSHTFAYVEPETLEQGPQSRPDNEDRLARRRPPSASTR